MVKPNGLNKCLTAFDQNNTLVAVVEMSQSTWLVAGIVPAIERRHVPGASAASDRPCARPPSVLKACVHPMMSRRQRTHWLSRPLRRRAVARYAGLTGSPDESGKRRREKGLAKAGSARVRRGMIQLAWCWLLHQKNSALTEWYRSRALDNRQATCKVMIVALARKLLIALWRLVAVGEVPQGVALRPAQ